MRESESDFMSWVIDLAKLRGWLVYHTWKSIHSPAGFPDLTMVRDGKLIFAELKVQGKVTAAQNEWLTALSVGDEVRQVYLWLPADRDEIEEILR